MSTLEEIIEKYKNYLNLNYVKSLEDSDDMPYESKYKARDLLNGLKTNLNKNLTQKNAVLYTYYTQLDDLTTRIYKKTSTSYMIEKLIDFNLAKNFIETEEYDYGERLLSSLIIELEKLIEHERDSTHSISIYNPLTFNILINCLNETVFVWSRRGNYEKCLKLLLKTKDIYDFYRNLYETALKSVDQNDITEDENIDEWNENIRFQVPFELNEIIELNSKLTNKKRYLIFESLYTHTMYYLAQIYGKLNEREKSAVYCQLTLQRQLDFNNTNDDFVDNMLQTTKIEFDLVEWATHAAAISQYYVYECEFSTARHCLYCSEAILEYLNENRLNLGKDEQYLNKLNEQTASIKRCWAKYAIELLKLSQEKLLESADNDNHLAVANLKYDYDKPAKFHFNFKKFKLVKNIDHYLNSIDTKYSSSIRTNLILDYEQAKKLFLKVQKILNEQVLTYYQLDGYVTDHCEIVRDLSELYKLLLFFDNNVDNKCKMHKRRLDLLKPIVDDLSEQFYLVLKRQYLFDCAEIYQQMMDFKLDNLHEKREELIKLGGNEALSQNENKKLINLMVNKINQLALSSIEYFEKFLNTMKLMPDKKQLPEKYDLNNTRPALLAHFYIGRLYSKLIPSDYSERLTNTKKTLEYYTYLVQYCEKHANDEELKIMDFMKVEYNVCKEMIAFMPVKMENIRKNIK